MIEDLNDPWFQDKAARRAAGESDVEFWMDADGYPWIWADHPEIVRADLGDDPRVVHLWLPFPAYLDRTFPQRARFEPARAADLVISNVGKIPPHGFWTLHPAIEFDRTTFDDDGGGYWRTELWLWSGTWSEEETQTMLKRVFGDLTP